MRLRAVVLIIQMNELCVCELTHTLGQAQPVISRHLSQLKETKILLARKQGQWVYYRINDALPKWHLMSSEQLLTASLIYPLIKMIGRHFTLCLTGPIKPAANTH